MDDQLMMDHEYDGQFFFNVCIFDVQSCGLNLKPSWILNRKSDNDLG